MFWNYSAWNIRSLIYISNTTENAWVCFNAKCLVEENSDPVSWRSYPRTASSKPFRSFTIRLQISPRKFDYFNRCLSWDLWSLSDLTHVSVCCTNRVMDKPLTNATSVRDNIRAEWTSRSRLSVIDLNSHVVHVITIRTLFFLRQLHTGTISHQKL